MKKLSLDSALAKITKEIEGKLQIEIVGIEKVLKIYGSNANSFIIKAVNKNRTCLSFFLKFLRNNELDEEINGTETLSKYIPTPQIVLTSKNNFFTSKWILYEHVKGSLFTEKFINHEQKNSNIDNLLELERRKESILEDMYTKTKGRISFNEYLNLRTNALFSRRINGSRFNEFYTFRKDCVSRYFNTKIKVNNHVFDKNINDIFKHIRFKYLNANNKDRFVSSVIGQGDAHHGNIIVTDNDKIWFIDNEYFGNIPSFMELSKPYYNDLIGELFFHYNILLSEYFELTTIQENENQLLIKIKPKRRLSSRIDITKIKLRSRNKFITGQKDIDFLSLNDYLIMCHTLTKNPNYYEEKTRYLFLAFTLILADFEPLNPESLYSFF